MRANSLPPLLIIITFSPSWEPRVAWDAEALKSLPLLVVRSWISRISKDLHTSAKPFRRSFRPSCPIVPLVGHRLLELLHGRLQLLLKLRRQLIALVDLLEDVRVVTLHIAVERLLKGAHPGQLNVVQVTVDAGVEDAHLLAQRQRPELQLLEHLRQPLPAR